MFMSREDHHTGGEMKNILSVDVEDWFHILRVSSTPRVEEWSKLEPRIERNFHFLLDQFDRNDAKATCFFLGWIGEKYSHLTRETAERGHEVACHGYGHQLIGTQTREQFRSDLTKAKDILEQAAGKQVRGYRAPGFSMKKETLWALEELVASGFEYDSSIFPTTRGHGGMAESDVFPHIISTPNGRIIEFPISVARLLGRKYCFFGGGYFRLSPYFLIRKMSRAVNLEGRPVIYYIHPREIDPSHPRLSMNLVRRFKSYVNLNTTTEKLNNLVKEQTLISFEKWLQENKTSTQWQNHEYSTAN